MKNFRRFLLMLSLTSFIVSGNSSLLFAQKLVIMDRGNNNKIVNDSTITVYSSDESINELTALFTFKNNTDLPLKVFLRKQINQLSDSTTDYFCFYIKCWAYADTTDIADTVPAGGEDYTFASHVTHVRRFDYPQPQLHPGLTSITYTIFDNTTFNEPVEASVTVIYHLSPLQINEMNAIKTEIYPNPATDFIQVKIDRLIPGKLKAILYNSQGAVVRSEMLTNYSNTITLNTNGLSSGVYTGILTSEMNTRANFRFVVLAR